LVEGVVQRTGLPIKTVKDVLAALMEETQDWISSGYRVDLLRIVTLDFKYVKPVRKGTLVFNPGTGEHQPSQGKSARLGLKARPGVKAKEAAPAASSKEGKELIAALT
jgi:nucleoid DNA-binding protein